MAESKKKIRKRSEKPETLRVKNAVVDLLTTGKYRFRIDLHAQLKKLGFNIESKRLNAIMRRMPISKYSDPETGIRYLKYVNPEDNSDSSLSKVSEFIHSIEENGALIVIKTSIGAASLIAKNIDFSLPNLPDIMCTLAGDDTVLVIPSHISKISNAINSLEYLFEIEAKQLNHKSLIKAKSVHPI